MLWVRQLEAMSTRVKVAKKSKIIRSLLLKMYPDWNLSRFMPIFQTRI